MKKLFASLLLLLPLMAPSSQATLLSLYRANSVSSAPVVLSGLTKAGSAGWDAAAWNSSLAATGDVDLTFITSGPAELVCGLISAAPSIVSVSWQTVPLDYGVLTYNTSQTVKMQAGNPDFPSQVFPLGGYTPGVTSFTIKRVGTDIIIQASGVTLWTITGVSSATALQPVCYGNPNGDMVVSSTWNGAPLAWSSFGGGVSAF